MQIRLSKGRTGRGLGRRDPEILCLEVEEALTVVYLPHEYNATRASHNWATNNDGDMAMARHRNVNWEELVEKMKEGGDGSVKSKGVKRVNYGRYFETVANITNLRRVQNYCFEGITEIFF